MPATAETPSTLRVLDETPLRQQDAEPELPVDWEQEVRYETLLNVTRVRDTINRHATMSRTPLSGEEFLKLCDKVMPMGVPLDKVAALVQPLYARLGIQTGKHRAGQVQAPIGRVMLRMLCSLARNGQTLRLVTQAEDGCCFEAVLPSDMFALEGNLIVGVRRAAGSTEVTAATKIPGQLFDWGKSNRCLETLFVDLERDVA
ncbi:MAG: hypothetical protein KF708_23515 [Pirellulales bacterium]|nr:hypothetical protein [Pirellulales bacterium]